MGQTVSKRLKIFLKIWKKKILTKIFFFWPCKLFITRDRKKLSCCQLQLINIYGMYIPLKKHSFQIYVTPIWFWECLNLNGYLFLRWLIERNVLGISSMMMWAFLESDLTGAKTSLSPNFMHYIFILLPENFINR